jgi:hypothetical protein
MAPVTKRADVERTEDAGRFITGPHTPRCGDQTPQPATAALEPDDGARGGRERASNSARERL